MRIVTFCETRDRGEIRVVYNQKRIVLDIDVTKDGRKLFMFICRTKGVIATVPGVGHDTDQILSNPIDFKVDRGRSNERRYIEYRMQDDLGRTALRVSKQAK